MRNTGVQILTLLITSLLLLQGKLMQGHRDLLTLLLHHKWEFPLFLLTIPHPLEVAHIFWTKARNWLLAVLALNFIR